MPHRILVVEDEPVVLTFVKTVLEREGYEVLTAATVAEARRILSAESPTSDLCLIVDVVLEQESGIAFAQEAIARSPGHRVLLVSGFTDEVLLPLPEHAERIGFLRKPFKKPELMAALDSVCHLKT